MRSPPCCPARLCSIVVASRRIWLARSHALPHNTDASNCVFLPPRCRARCEPPGLGTHAGRPRRRRGDALAARSTQSRRACCVRGGGPAIDASLADMMTPIGRRRPAWLHCGSSQARARGVTPRVFSDEFFCEGNTYRSCSVKRFCSRALRTGSSSAAVSASTTKKTRSDFFFFFTTTPRPQKRCSRTKRRTARPRPGARRECRRVSGSEEFSVGIRAEPGLGLSICSLSANGRHRRIDTASIGARGRDEGSRAACRHTTFFA